MSITDSERYRSQLLIERIAEHTHVDSLAHRVPGVDPYPPYLLVGLVLFIEYGIFDLYNYFISGKNSFIIEPNSLAVPAMVILSVVGARYINDTYADAITTLRIDDRDISTDQALFEDLVSFRVQMVVTIVVWVTLQGFNVFVLGFGELIQINGIGLVIYSQLAYTFVYIPVLVEFGLAYFTVHFAVPRRIEKAGVSVFFYDPRKMGGFQSIGELLKRSYYLYTLTLILYFFQTKGPVVLSQYTASPYSAPNAPIIEVVLSVAWLVGVVTIGYSMYRIHSIMKSQKERRIRELEGELTNVMERPFKIRKAEITDQDQYEKIRDRLQHVQDTKTYPTTFTMWSQIFLSVLLPQALNLVV